MKQKYLIALSILILSIFSFATNLSAEEEVLLGGRLENGGFGGPSISAGQINDEMGLFVGGRGAWIINHTFSIGFGGEGLVSNHRVQDYTQAVTSWGYDEFGNYRQINIIDSSWYLSDMGYGGIILEYIYNSNSIFHFTGSVLIGGGSIAYNHEPITMQHNNNYMYDNDNITYDKKRSSFFVIVPSVNAELNVAKWFRLNAGVSYKIVTNVDMPKTTNAQLSGLSGNIIFKFGKF